MGVDRREDGDRPGIWFRVLLPTGAIGPGKVALMRAVAATGSVSAAARRMRMSHARSVNLVSELNALCPTPLIETRTGGEAGGGARLTELGKRILETYDRLNADLRDAAAGPVGDLVGLLSDG